MKLRIFSFIAIIALASVSCELNENYLTSEGTISFRAGTKGMLTRAEYSDVVDNVANIQWQTGDKISIHCDQAVGSKQADYVVKSTNSGKNGISEAVIECVKEDEALTWGPSNVEHKIYAVFPSPSASLYDSDEFDGDEMKGYIFENQKPVSIQKLEPGVYDAKANLLSQYMVAKTSTKPKTRDGVFLEFHPLVTAIEFEIQNDYSIVDSMRIASIQLLSQNHALNGAFRLDLNSWTPGSLPSTSSDGLYEGSKKVVMDFTADKQGYKALGRGEKLKFTFFLLPNENIDDLFFRVVDPDGGYVTTKLAYSDDPTYGNQGVSFPRCKKSFVKGLLVPEGARWIISYAPELESWSQHGAGKLDFSNPKLHIVNFLTSWLSGNDEYVEMDGMYEYKLNLDTKNELSGISYRGGEVKDAINIVSYKYNEDFPMRGANWKVQIYDSVNDKWVDASSNPANNPPGLHWLAFDRVDGSGDGHISVTIAKGQPNHTDAHGIRDEIVYDTLSIADHDAILRNAAEKGTESRPWDLSSHDIYGKNNSKGVETANCYVINSSGWYAFPLVYGNAMTKGAPNPVSYNPTYSSTSQRYLQKFQNTIGSSSKWELLGTSGALTATANFNPGQIKSPYIEDDNDDTAYSYVGCAGDIGNYTVTNKWSAFPIWQDTNSALVNDNASSCYVISKTEAANRGLSLGGKCGYVVFHVNKANLTQGNILIGVKQDYERYHMDYEVLDIFKVGEKTRKVSDKKWDRYYWSWHIWVTDEPLSTVAVDNGQGMKSDVMPVNLGWVDGGQTIKTSYKMQTAKIRIAQPRGNEPDQLGEEITITRLAHPLSVISPDGSSPYYQWGRPTPMPRLKTLKEKSIENVSLLMHSGYSINAKRVTNAGTIAGFGGSLLMTSIGNVLNDPTSFYGSASVDVGVVFVYECYEQWFCEPYGGAGGLLLLTAYAFCNLWNAQCVSGANETLPTVKTIYDPCPPGFCVPNGDSFSGIIADGSSDFQTHRGINFYTSNDRDETIFFPAVGRISRGSTVNLETSGNMLVVGTEGDYWLSTGGATGIFTVASQNDSHAMHIASGNTNGTIQQSSRSQGMSVRPQVIVDWIK